jgi:hypothetical protein
MKAYISNPSGVLGASLTGALRWEGHSLVSSISEADVVFDTTYGVVYRQDRALVRFVFGELLGPGDVAGTCVGDWLIRYLENGRAPSTEGGACITDGRDVALAMIAAAERGVGGEFETIGPYYSFEELSDLIEGLCPSRANLAMPELGISFRPAENTIADVIESLRPARTKVA